MGKTRHFAALAVISAMIFTGCNNAGNSILEKTPDIDVPFESEMKIQAGELEFEGNIKRFTAGVWEMDITAPETLSGLCISYDDSSGVKAVLDGLEAEIPPENINDGAVFALMFKAMDCAAAAGQLSCADTEDGKVYSGEFSGGTYMLTFDPKTAALTHIEIPYGEIEGEFTNFTVTKSETVPPGTTEASS